MNGKNSGVWDRNEGLAERVIALTKEDMSAAQIASKVSKEFGDDVSTNMVIGYLSRRGIGLKNAIASSRPRQRAKRIAMKKAIDLPIFLAKRPSDAKRLDLEPRRPRSEPYIRPGAECAFLMDGPPPLQACGKPVHKGSYCKEHHKLCTQAPNRQYK